MYWTLRKNSFKQTTHNLNRMAISLHELNSLPTRADLVATEKKMLEILDRMLKRIDNIQSHLVQFEVQLGFERIGADCPAHLRKIVEIKEFYDTREFMEMTGMSKSTLHRWLNENDIRVRQPNGYKSKLYIPYAAWELWREKIDKDVNAWQVKGLCVFENLTEETD